MYRAFWLIAVSLMLPAAVLAQEGDQRSNDEQADQEAIRNLLRQVLDEEDEQDSSEPAQEEPAQEEPAPPVAIRAARSAPPPPGR